MFISFLNLVKTKQRHRQSKRLKKKSLNISYNSHLHYRFSRFRENLKINSKTRPRKLKFELINSMHYIKLV